MGMTAHIYRTKGKGIRTPLHKRNTQKDIELAYFRNNYRLNELIDYANGGRFFLSVEDLKRIKDAAKRYPEVNKDYGDGQSVLSVIDTIIQAAKDGYIVYYDVSY